MKTLAIIFSTLFLSTCLMAAEPPLISIDTSRVQSIAIKAITAKYVDLKPGDLVFAGILYSVPADGSEGLITATYKLTASTKKENVSTTRSESIDVALSNAGKVMNVSKGEIISSQSQ
jgi:hypothetical protein